MAVRIDQEGPVTIVSLARPEVKNAVNPETAEALMRAFLEFSRNPDAHIAVLYGEGGAFCAGYDLKEVGDLPADIMDKYDFPIELPAHERPSMDNDGPSGPMGPSRLTLDKPVIAAIEGPAVAGGMELALWCDMRVMAEDAFMGVFCRRWGVPLVDGGTVRLPRIVGMGRAMDLILTGRKVDAKECHEIGLCERVTSSGTARQAAVALAQEIAKFPQACMRSDRRSAYAQWDLSMTDALQSEWRSKAVFVEEGVSGAARFASGKGRGGDFENI